MYMLIHVQRVVFYNEKIKTYFDVKFCNLIYPLLERQEEGKKIECNIN